jgi:AbrB family looped-hinge helix DNA binding protein
LYNFIFVKQIGFCMKTVSLSPKYQLVIPKEIRRMFNLVPGQQMRVQARGKWIEVVPEITMASLRGMCSGVDNSIPDDPEPIDATWPGGCAPLPEHLAKQLG